MLCYIQNSRTPNKLLWNFCKFARIFVLSKKVAMKVVLRENVEKVCPELLNFLETTVMWWNKLTEPKKCHFWSSISQKLQTLFQTWQKNGSFFRLSSSLHWCCLTFSEKCRLSVFWRFLGVPNFWHGYKIKFFGENVYNRCFWINWASWYTSIPNEYKTLRSVALFQSKIEVFHDSRWKNSVFQNSNWHDFRISIFEIGAFHSLQMIKWLRLAETFSNLLFLARSEFERIWKTPKSFQKWLSLTFRIMMTVS